MKLSRRHLLRNISASSLLWPLNGIFAQTQAFGQVSTGRKALFLYYPNGSIAGDFFPNQTSSLPYITSPLQAHSNDISFVKGLQFNLRHGSHEQGAQYVLTGVGGGRRYSIDNFVGDRVSANHKYKNLRLGVGSNFQTGNDKQISYLSSGTIAHIEDYPYKVFQDMFGGGSAAGSTSISADKSVLDFSLDELKTLQGRLGQIEKEKLDEHLNGLRELEKSIHQTAAGQCSAQWNGQGLNFPKHETGYPVFSHRNEHFGKVSRIMIDLMVQAMSCGLTNVGLIQWSHAVSPTRFDFIGGPGVAMGHHDASHFGGDTNGVYAMNFKKMQRWIMNEYAYLISELKAKGLWNSTVLMGTTELGDSNLHNFKNIPCFIAGRAGGALRQGQVIDRAGGSYNHLLTTVLQSMGINQNHFGYDGDQGTIAELLA